MSQILRKAGTMRKQVHVWGLSVVACLAMLTTAAQADELLIVDLSVVDQVTVNATAGLSAVDASGSDTTGIYLADFYTGPGVAVNISTGTGDFTSAENLPDGSPGIFRSTSDVGTGLNIWTWTADNPATFTAGALAFTGSGTWSISSDQYMDMLASNASGNIYFPADTGDDIPNAQLLGTYSVVVPEPAALSMIALGLGLVMLGRKR